LAVVESPTLRWHAALHRAMLGSRTAIALSVQVRRV